MVAAYNARAENQVKCPRLANTTASGERRHTNPDIQGLTRDEMLAYQGNLCDPDEPTPSAFAGAEFSNFDVAAVGLGFHVSLFFLS